jgi:prolyl oligopeptidase
LIYENSDPEISFAVTTSEDDKYLMLFQMKGTDIKNLVSYADLTHPEVKKLDKKIEFKPIIDQWVGAFNYVQNFDLKFFFDTSYNAPKGKVIAIDLARPD